MNNTEQSSAKESIERLEEFYNNTRIANEKQMARIDRGVEYLGEQVRNIKRTKKKGDANKDINSRIEKIEAKLVDVPSQLDDLDSILQDIIGKIINIESSNCDNIPTSSTSTILNYIKEEAAASVADRSVSQEKEDTAEEEEAEAKENRTT